MQPNTDLVTNLVIGSGVTATYTPGLQLTSNLVAGSGLPGTPGADGAPGTNGQGVPAGGNAGQILAKFSNGDFATVWQDPNTTATSLVLTDANSVQWLLSITTDGALVTTVMTGGNSSAFGTAFGMLILG